MLSVAGLVFSSHKMSRSLYLPLTILKVHIEALTVVGSYGLNNTLLSKAVSLKQLLVWDRWAEHIFQVQGRG